MAASYAVVQIAASPTAEMRFGIGAGRAGGVCGLPTLRVSVMRVRLAFG